MKPVTIYDTTLRDGTQGTGISFSILDKIRVAQRLDAFGVEKDNRCPPLTPLPSRLLVLLPPPLPLLPVELPLEPVPAIGRRRDSMMQSAVRRMVSFGAFLVWRSVGLL